MSDQSLGRSGTFKGATIDSSQSTKAVFVLDAGGKKNSGKKVFGFQPHDFGPSAEEMYRELEERVKQGLVEISFDSSGRKEFRLTLGGQKKVDAHFRFMDEPSRKYVRSVSNWIRERTFHELLSTIYREFSEMAANSVFREQA